MSRPELADAVNAALDQLYPDQDMTAQYVDPRWVGKLERGEHRWPSEERRAALRHVLGAPTDTELDLFSPRRTDPLEDGVCETGEIDRRNFLRAGVLTAAVQVPAALTLGDLAHLLAAAQDAHRYLDHEVVDHLRGRLDACSAADGTKGARKTLPTMLGLLGVVEQHCRQVKPAVRASLLSVGARSAEFTGWLYRDLGQPQLADYWRDLAVEWSSAAGDEAMGGYILLKKSQSAWDERDATRMLKLVALTQNCRRPLPTRVRAEALQQEARGHAMASGNARLVEDKLRQARDLLLAHDRSDQTGRDALAEHYDQALLGVQTAMCYREAGQLDRAVDLYRRWLSPKVFSRRDYGYFLALKAETLAATTEVDAPTQDGVTALKIAVDTDSVRTLRELGRLGTRLKPWSDRPAVRSFLGDLRTEASQRGLR